MAPVIGAGKKILRTVGKRTSQGIKFKPKNKNKRRHWKAYRGQGRA